MSRIKVRSHCRSTSISCEMLVALMIRRHRGANSSLQGKLVTNFGVVGKFSFLTVGRTYPVVGKAHARPRKLNQISYRSTEFVISYPASPKKSDFHQWSSKILPTFLPGPQCMGNEGGESKLLMGLASLRHKSTRSLTNPHLVSPTFILIYIKSVFSTSAVRCIPQRSELLSNFHASSWDPLSSKPTPRSWRRPKTRSRLSSYTKRNSFASRIGCVPHFCDSLKRSSFIFYSISWIVWSTQSFGSQFSAHVTTSAASCAPQPSCGGRSMLGGPGKRKPRL